MTDKAPARSSHRAVDGGLAHVLPTFVSRRHMQYPSRGNEEMGVETYNENGEWKSKVQGSSRAAHVGGTKAQQQAVGRQMAQERGTEHTIKRLDRTIGQKNSYGNDPHPPRDKN